MVCTKRTLGGMRKPWMADLPGCLRRLAVERVGDGHSQAEVAQFLGVSDRSIRRWVAADRDGGTAALLSKPRPGRPPKLTDEQAEQVLRWLRQGNPSHFGFPTERWTAPRVAELIERRFGARMNHRYLNDWLRRHRITPQVPARVARERDEAAVRWWVARVWPRIKKKPKTTTRNWDSPMKPGC